MSVTFAAEIRFARSREWFGNKRRFRTERGALALAANIAENVAATTDIRVVETDDPVDLGDWGHLDDQ